MSARRTSVFLERQSYRRRRIMDAARLLPLLGVAFFAVPLLWSKPGDGSEAASPVAMSTAVSYVFGVWAILIVLAFLFGFKSRGWGPGGAPEQTRRGGG